MATGPPSRAYIRYLQSLGDGSVSNHHASDESQRSAHTHKPRHHEAWCDTVVSHHVALRIQQDW